MSRTYAAGARSADTPAATALKAKMAADRGAKAKSDPKPASVTPAQNARVKWTPSIAASAAARAVTGRAIAVMRSPQFERHRDLALQLFRNPKMTGPEIVATLAIAGANGPAEEEAALAEMKAALAQAAMDSRGAASISTQGAGPSRSAAIWAKAHEQSLGEASQ